MRRFLRGEAGSIGVMGAGVLGTVMLMTGAAMDMAALSATRAALKDAADAGALAAARAIPENARDAAESMFDLTFERAAKRARRIERTYALDGEEHVLTATVRMRSYVLGALDGWLLGISAESAAIPASDRPEDHELAPCIHVGGGQGAALTVDNGAVIEGAGCLLVLNDDDPDRISVDGATLDIAGFCIDGDAAPARVSILETRLGLPYRPESCAPIKVDYGLPGRGCRGLKDDTLPLFRDGTGAFHRYQGESYCGDVNLDGASKFVRQQGQILEALGGDMRLRAQALEVPSGVMIVSQSLPDLEITVQAPSYVRAPEAGPYAGVAVLLKTTAHPKSNLVLKGPVAIEGRIIGPGLTVRVDGETLGEPREMQPLRAAHLKVGPNSHLRFVHEAADTVTVRTLHARLVR